MWIDADIDRWISLLTMAQGLGYVEARKRLLQVRDEVGAATVTEAHKQKRARYLAKKAARKARVADVQEAGKVTPARKFSKLGQ
jgi:hypothetical protein